MAPIAHLRVVRCTAVGGTNIYQYGVLLGYYWGTDPTHGITYESNVPLWGFFAKGVLLYGYCLAWGVPRAEGPGLYLCM